jgi:hypothetical protein
MMNGSISNSSLGGDDSTVSSKSRRIRSHSGGIASRSPYTEAEFSDMPSLSSYRGDEASLASTLRTDCDQSLPSLSSCRTRDLSIASGSYHSRNNQIENRDNSLEGSAYVGNQNRGSESDLGEDNNDEQPGTHKSQQSGLLKVEDSTTYQAVQYRHCDSLPRLPRRTAEDDEDSQKYIRMKELGANEDSDLDISDQSPDISVDSNQIHDEPLQSAHDPARLTLSTTNINSSPARSVSQSFEAEEIVKSNEGYETRDNMVPKKKSSSRSFREPINPPVEITTPPTKIQNRKTSSNRSNENAKPAKSKNRKPLKSKKCLEAGARSQTRNYDMDEYTSKLNKPDEPKKTRPRVRRYSHTGTKTKKDRERRRSLRRTSSESGDRLAGEFKNEDERQHECIRKANSEMAQVLDGISKEDQKRGLVRRLSNSLKHIAKPVRTRPGNFGQAFKSKLKRKGKKSDR